MTPAPEDASGAAANPSLRPPLSPSPPLSLSLSERTTADIGRLLAGGERRPWSALLFAGPAVIASIAYVDPGNFATNIQAGSQFGYSLLWVVLVANLIAMLFQALSAKLGIVTGKNLAELCGETLPRGVVYPMWAASELAAMATDLAEFIGGAIGLSLLFGLPLLAGMGIVAVVTTGILLLDRRGFRPMELVIGAFVVVIALCYLAEMLIVPVDWAAVGAGLVTPAIANGAALTIAVGIIGATVMPHAVFLHSALTQARAPAQDIEARRALVRFSNREVIVALALAGAVNLAMVIMASSAFHAGHREVAEIETAYHTLTPLFGAAAASVFLVSLIASGLSSSVVGTLAGQVIMQGFVGFRIPLWLRRLVTMLPAFIIVGLGVNATQALVLSQVVLSFVLPVPMIALTVFTRRRSLMGEFRNSRLVDAAALGGCAIVLALNAVLVAQTAGLF